MLYAHLPRDKLSLRQKFRAPQMFFLTKQNFFLLQNSFLLNEWISLVLNRTLEEFFTVLTKRMCLEIYFNY